MIVKVSSDDDIPDMIRQLRVAESILEYLTSDIDRRDLPGLWNVLEGARTYAEELLLFWELSGGGSKLEGLLEIRVTKSKNWPTVRTAKKE